MKRRITIKDIAQRLGISTSTVSRALADQWDVSRETRNRVMQMAAAMGYSPNPIAVKLQNKRSRIIGLVVPEFYNSFFPTIIVAIQRILDQHGYQLLITQSNESSLDERRNLKLLQSNMVEGILLSTTKEAGNAQLYQEIIDAGTPILFFNRACATTRASRVVIDDMLMAFSATEHIIRMGRRHIAHLAGPTDLEMSVARRNGYIRALKKYNIPIDNDLIITAGLSCDQGYSEMSQLLERGVEVDGLFAMCDPVAIGAMRAIKERAISIPEQIAVVGFSESRSATLVEPNLTSVAQPLTEIGEIAAEMLIAEINAIYQESSHQHQTVVVPAKLNIRESSYKASSEL